MGLILLANVGACLLSPTDAGIDEDLQAFRRLLIRLFLPTSADAFDLDEKDTSKEAFDFFACVRRGDLTRALNVSYSTSLRLF